MVNGKGNSASRLFNSLRTGFSPQFRLFVTIWYKIAIVFFFFSFSACERQNNAIESYEKFKIGVDSLLINGHKIDRNTSSVFSGSNISKNYISYLAPDGIIIYSLVGNRYIEHKVIPIKQYDNVLSYYILSLDSIYVLNSGNEINLLNGEGKLIKTTSVNKWILSGMECPLIGDSHHLYMYYFPMNRLNTLAKTLAYFKRHLELVIDKADFGKIDDSIGICPEKYLTKYYYDNVPWRAEISDFKMAYSFAGQNELIVYNFKTRTYSTPSMQSKSFRENNEFDFSKTTNQDYQYVTKYLVENDRYGSIIYDKYRNKVYRVCTHGVTFEKKDSTVNTIKDKEWSLIVSNPDFKIEKELVFPGGLYDLNHIYVTNQGVLVKKQNIGYNDKVWVYDVFKF